MRKIFQAVFVFLFLMICHTWPVLAQSNRDSLQQKIEGLLLGKIHKIDSTQSRIANKIDSITKRSERVVHFSDSLKPALAKYNRKLETIKEHLKHRIDSLERLNLPTGQYSHLLDSIGNAGPLEDVRQAEGKLTALEQKVNAPVAKVNTEISTLESKINQKLNLFNKEERTGTNLRGNIKLPNVQGQGISPNLPKSNIDIPGSIPNNNLNLRSGSLPNVTNPLNGGNGSENNNLAKDFGKETSELKNITNVPQKELSQLRNTGEVGQAEKELGQFNLIEHQAKGYSKDVQKVSKGNLDSLTVTKTLENKAMQMSPLKPFQSETGTISQYKAMAAKGNDPKAMEKLAMEQAQKQVVNHFAGKEKGLHSAMSQIGKYKQKYASLTSIRDIPKRACNTMHSKPLVERLVPGITLQVLKKSTVMVDFNPQAGYRFNDRLTVGAGWNERVGFYHYTRITHKERIYGPRTFAEFKFKKGFALRAELETMNTLVPPLTVGSSLTDPNARQWVWGVFGGIKKEYNLSKSIRGNIQMMYNFHDRFYKTSPYADRLNVRMGFEFPMKKKVKRDSK